ncbi:MAG: polysaccharide deacetylase family protein [Paludibacteraceae bacterium]|nr:polysaccharide deacetylase family protein [Paludibacteraceae bacterium]
MVKLRDIWQCLYPYGVFRTGKAVYLTFDDGPIPEVTPKVLTILAKYNVKATFFMVGENIDKHPEVFRQVVEAGHQIGNHTYNHLKGWKTPFDEYMSNVARCNKALFEHHPSVFIPTLFRPPYGKATLRQRIALHKMGYTLIYWDVLTRDYDASVTPEQMLRLIQRETRPGSIINFHDSLKSNERMLRVLPQAIEWLQKEGYEIRGL